MQKRNSSRPVIVNLSVDQNHNKVLRSREKTQKQHDEKIQNDWQLISSAKRKLTPKETSTSSCHELFVKIWSNQKKKLKQLQHRQDFTASTRRHIKE